MLKELIPNHIYKPGTKVVVTDKKFTKLLSESIFTIVSCVLDYNTNNIVIRDDETFSIDYSNNPYSNLSYKILLERVGKTGKKRMEVIDLKMPLFKTDDTFFVAENSDIKFDALSALNDNDFIYWILSRLIFNLHVEQIFLSKFKFINSPLISAIRVERSVRYKHTAYLMHLLNNTDEENRIREIANYFKILKNKEETILELREMEGKLSQAKLHYSIKLMGKIRICMEIYKYNNDPLVTMPEWKQFEAFVGNIIRVNQGPFRSVRPKEIFNLPYDNVMQDALLYAMTWVT